MRHNRKVIDAVEAWVDAQPKDRKKAFNNAVRECEKELFAEIEEYKRTNHLSWKEQTYIHEQIIPNVHDEAMSLVLHLFEH